MPDTTFDVTRFQNRNGTVSWRVSGWLHGLRVRKNFKTREEAAAEKAVLAIKALQASGGVRAVSTFLHDDQLREAEAAFRRLKDAPQSLTFYLDYGLANYRAPECDITVNVAVSAYLAAKQKECERGMLSACQLKDIRVRLDGLTVSFPDRLLSQISQEDLSAHCQRGNPKPKTFNNRRGILFTFFKYAFCQDWVVANPLEKVPHLRIAHQRGSAKTLSAEQAEALMRRVEKEANGAFVPFFAICLFAGIRPCLRTGEISKLRGEHIRLDTGVIHIEPDVSKVRMKRNVTIQPNLAAWLKAYPLERYPIIPANLQHVRARLAKEFCLSHDVMRHTYISMHVARFRSVGDAALQAGNSESIIRRHYLDLKTATEAEAFFAILPSLVAVSDRADG